MHAYDSPHRAQTVLYSCKPFLLLHPNNKPPASLHSVCFKLQPFDLTGVVLWNSIGNVIDKVEPVEPSDSVAYLVPVDRVDGSVHKVVVDTCTKSPGCFIF